MLKHCRLEHRHSRLPVSDGNCRKFFHQRGYPSWDEGYTGSHNALAAGRSDGRDSGGREKVQMKSSRTSEDMVCSWLRPLCIATLIGLTLTICQLPLHRGAMVIYHAEPDVARCASQYFHILIWGAPLVLIHYVNLGWLMGRGLVRHVLVLQIGTNILKTTDRKSVV